MKSLKLFAVALFAMLLAAPAMAQGTSLSTVANEKARDRQSNFIKAVEAAGPYTQLYSDEITQLKLASVSTLGGYTLRCEKFTDMASGKSVQAVKVTPNTATGIGKLVSGATGLGSHSETFYVDADEVSVLLSHIEKMKAACEKEPAVNSTYTFTTRDGFSISLGYVVNGKKAIKLGQIGQTGEVPFVNFLSEVERAFKEASAGFANLK
ncbi:MAG: hypothetical protein RSC11_03465 [Mucinivorans sp.]